MILAVKSPFSTALAVSADCLIALESCSKPFWIPTIALLIALESLAISSFPTIAFVLGASFLA